MRPPEVLLATLAVIIGGCVDATSPQQSASENARGIPPGAPDEIVSVEIALEDATGRILASVDDARFASHLRNHLQDLRIALSTRDEQRARRSISLARALIKEADQESESADLGVVELAIDQAEVELDGRTADSEPNSPLTGNSQ